MKSITRQLSDFITSYSYEKIPKDVISEAKACLFDTLGGALIAADYTDVSGIIGELLQFENGGKCSTVWGTNQKASLQSALLLNGTMGHTTETDDVHKLAKVHAGAIIVPTVLTLGEYLKATGEDIIRALILGYEVALRIGIGIGAGSHRLKGWHATGTCGIFGAAVSAAVLLKLNTEEIVSALGIAGTQASGLWAFLQDGASCKKFHAGRAAHGGVLAALLAKGGMTGSAYILDAEDGGLYKASSEDYSYDTVIEGLGTHWRIKEVDRKPYPCCRSTHPIIDSMLALRKIGPIEVKDIKEIQVDTYEVGYLQCGRIYQPKTIAEAQFSSPYCAAVALIDGQVSIDKFSKTTLQRADIQELARRVVVKERSRYTEAYPENWGCHSKIIFKNGRRMEIEIKNAAGDHEVPLSEEELKLKFFNLISPKYDANRINDLIEMIIYIDQIRDVSELVEKFRR